MAEEQNRSTNRIELLCRDVSEPEYRSVVLSADRIRIGRRYENDVVLSHASVSRTHAEIVRDGDRWFVVDCDSKFGTLVNGEQIVRAEISPGDEIRIGGPDGAVIVFNPPAAVPTGDDLPVQDSVAEAREPMAVAAEPALAPEELAARPHPSAMHLVEQFRATSLIGDYREALALVADAALELTHFDRAVLLLADGVERDDPALLPEVVRSRAGHAPAAEVERATAFAHGAVAAGHIILVSPELRPSDSESALAALVRSAGIVRAVCVPLRTVGNGTASTTGETRPTAVGALFLESGSGAPPVTDGVREVLESLAGEAALAVVRLRARQDDIARIRAERFERAAAAQAVAADESQPLATRARAVREVADFLMLVGDLDGATAVLEAFEDPAVRANLPQVARAEVLLVLGQTLMWDHRWHRAAGILNAALDAAVEGQNPRLEMLVRSQLARSYVEIGELGIAREYALSAVSVLRRADEASVDYAKALHALGILEQVEGDLAGAAHTFRTAARVAEGTDDLLVRASAHYRLGLVHAERGDTSEAIPSFQRMLEVAHPVGNAALLLTGQIALASLLVRSGAWQRAEAVIAAALATAGESARHAAQRVQLLLLAATISVRRDGGMRAKEAIGAVRAHAVRPEDRTVVAEADLLEAEACLELRDLEGARVALASASAVASELRNPSLQARVHLALAEVERRVGAFAAADVQILLAQPFANESRDLMIAGAIQRAIGQLHADRSRFTEAQHSLAQSLSIFRTVDDRRQIGAVHLDLGNLMLAAGDPACARTHLKLAKEVFADLGIRWAREAAEAGLEAAISKSGPDAPASYSSILLASKTEPQFVRRLLDATQSRGLLLRELTSIALDVTHASSAAVVACLPGGALDVVASSGDETQPSFPVLAVLKALQGDAIRSGGFTLYPIEGAGEGSANAAGTVLAVNVELVPKARQDAALLVIVELARQGLELVTLRSSLKRVDLPDPVRFDGGDGEGRVDELGVGLVYAAAPMVKLAERILKIRTSDSAVLITGESGTGKELVARAVHTVSARSDGPYIPYNCSAAPRELIESQIFGHKRGAFTGATSDHAGVARAAQDGTLFLDEVGDLPIDLQPKLLRFLESNEIQPLGENAPLKVNVRVVAATNAEIERAIDERRFREDLYHRLNVIRLHVPPLRERAEDIPLLISHFLAQFAERAGLERPPAVAAEAFEALMAFSWPGNVRQLRNELERIVAFDRETSVVTLDHLSDEIRTFEARPTGSSSGVEAAYTAASLPLAERLKLFEIDQISRALADAGMNLTRAAGSLGMARQNLQRRLKKLGLSSPES